MDTRGAIDNARRQMMLEAMDKRVDKHKDRLHNLQNVVFQLANYYFVFQGVILASISNASSLNCSNRWFLFTLPLFAAIINLFAIYSIGIKYIVTLSFYDISWKEYNDLTFELTPRNEGRVERSSPFDSIRLNALNSNSEFFSAPSTPQPAQCSPQIVGDQLHLNREGQQWEDPYTN